MDASLARKQAIEDLLIQEGRRVDASGVLDALSGGEILFSPAQYASIVAWLNQGVTDFASNPNVRWQVYRMWTDAPLLGEPEDAERAQQMLRGGSVFAVSPARPSVWGGSCAARSSRGASPSLSFGFRRRGMHRNRMFLDVLTFCDTGSKRGALR